MKNFWIEESAKVLVDSPVMCVVESQRRSSEDGRKHRFFQLKAREWCNIIPVTESGTVVFVKQFRVGIDAHTLEIPGGVAEGEHEQVQAAALRELAEETGYAPLANARCVALGWTHPNPAIQNNRCHSFIVGPVGKTASPKLDYGEMIETAEIPIDEIEKKILSGAITHALMLNTFLFAQIRSHSSSLADALREFTR